MSRAALCGVLACGALQAGAEAPYRFDTTPGQLPKTILPRAYRIDLVPDLAAARFTAHEEIDVTVAHETSTVTLNAIDLRFSSVVLDERSPADTRIVIDRPHETVQFSFATPLAVGRHTLRIAYSGPITAAPSGLYYNDYVTRAGPRRLLVTQFEATEARRMFPSWDEPSFKATFRLSVVLPKAAVAISNMPVAAEAPAGEGRHGEQLKKLTFAVTPSMSTYLVALVAGELKAVRGKSGTTDVAVWAVGEQAAQGRSALGDALLLLPYFNDYFAVDYPLAKLDLIAIPGNFDAGAMENWGAITFIDDDLLFDARASSAATREDIFETVAHEMAHQWTGDLVTMAWWDNLWLNEGFATWMESKAADALKPGWRVWLRSHAGKERAMASDARSTARAIQSPVANESDAKAVFDDITYLKGAQLIRMIEAYLGEGAFRDGLRAYVKAHAYSNATTADLWNALDSVSGRDVSGIAAGFASQPGVPLIRVATHCERGQLIAELSQSRFTIHDPAAAPLTWQVPVLIGEVGPQAPPPRSVVVGATPQAVAFPGCRLPVKANLGDIGYYRVTYDAATRTELIASMAQLGPADRVNLISDQWALVLAGAGQVGAYLDLIGQLGDEPELVVWTEVSAQLRELDRLERGTPDSDAYRRWARAIVHPTFDRLGWTPRAGESSDDVLLRGELVDLLGRLDDREVLAHSRVLYAAFTAHPGALDPSLRDAVITNVGRTADQATFDALRARGRRATTSEEKLRYYYALAAAQDPRFIAQVVAIAAGDEVVPARAAYVIEAAAASAPDPAAVWRETLIRREAILGRLTEDQRERVLAWVAAPNTDEAVADELLSLPTSTATTGGAYEAKRIADLIRASAELKTRLVPEVRAWLIKPRPVTAEAEVRR